MNLPFVQRYIKRFNKIKGFDRILTYCLFDHRIDDDVT